MAEVLTLAASVVLLFIVVYAHDRRLDRIEQKLSPLDRTGSRRRKFEEFPHG